MGWGNGNRFQIDFSIPVFFADSSTPRAQVVGADEYCFGGPDCDEVPAQMPVPEDANFEGSSDLTCDISGNTETQGDCHLLVVDKDEGTLYEIYQGTKTGDDVTAVGFFVWDLTNSYPDTLRGEQCTSADAAGFPIAPLTTTADEVASGAINHALRFILPNDRMKEAVYVAPATHAGGPESTDANAPPYGVRFRSRPAPQRTTGRATPLRCPTIPRRGLNTARIQDRVDLDRQQYRCFRCGSALGAGRSEHRGHVSGRLNQLQITRSSPDDGATRVSQGAPW